MEEESSTIYRNNHYVPVWYQKRFIPPGFPHKELLYLDLSPGRFTDLRGVSHPFRSIRRLGPRHCFSQEDLYTQTLGDMPRTEIEKYFFGGIDWHGKKAVEHFSGYDGIKRGSNEALEPLLLHMSTQKLRTPKGLAWLADRTHLQNRDVVLATMVRFRQLFCAIWTECVWQIADASQSETKFLLSDCPVTVYNRSCGPRSHWCRGNADPDIWLNGTHTLFPLSLDSILILTNLSWVRNPYQDPMKARPNPNPLRDAIFSFLDIQLQRHLCEQEVREINFIIKSRARKYVAAFVEDWLYPDRYVSKSNWPNYGQGYLLMPDPRSVRYYGEILIGHKDGTATAFDEYGRRPWQRDFRASEAKPRRDLRTFHRFQGEFARLFGPYRRGRTCEFGELDRERDDDEFHRYHLSLEEKYRKAR